MAAKNGSGPIVEDPAFIKILFNSTRWSWVWFVVRLYVGYQWLTSGWGKFGNPAWMQTGEALKAYWARAVAVPAPPARPPITYGWYRDFLNFLLQGEHHVWFAKFVVWGEILVGAALILGILTGFAAFAGGFMNMNFMLAGSASTNPVLYTLAILLILAWKVAGHWGVDRWLLPLIGTPWGWMKRPEPAKPSPTEA